MGYERADGSVGIRNYILVLSVVNCANTVAQQIAAKTGAHVIPSTAAAWRWRTIIGAPACR